jgi:hypothetical protein
MIYAGRGSFPAEYLSRSETLVEAQPIVRKSTSRNVVKVRYLFMETSGSG